MIYIINNKYYVNTSPSIYTEVLINKNGTIKATSNKIEINANTVMKSTSLAEEVKKLNSVVENNDTYKMEPRYTRRNKK